MERQLSFTELNSKGEFAYFDHTENAIDSLETASYLLNRTGNTKWKWVSISIHHSLYSFCISYLFKGDFYNVSFINKNSGKRELISFGKALNKTLNTPFYTYPKGQPQRNKINLPLDKRKKIDWLSYAIRNGFVHFLPKVTRIELTKIKKACLVIINLVELIAISSNSITYLNFEEAQNKSKCKKY